MPEWLIEILRQFPMVVVIGYAIWYAEKRVREKEIRLESRADELLKNTQEREGKIRAEVREDRDAEIERFRQAQQSLLEANAKLLTAKDEQIAKLTETIETFAKQLAALTKKLSG